MKLFAFRFAILLAAACFSVSEASATTITVNNASFETLPGGGLPIGCGTACSYSIDLIPGWTNSGFSGQFQPGAPATTAYLNSVPDGLTVAYTNGPMIDQVVGATVQDGVTYTLTVDLGSRNDTGFGSAAGLFIGGNFYAATGTVPTAGNWSTFTATFTGTAATAGDAIDIQLLMTGAQGDFDNVQLSDNTSGSGSSVVPEPSSLSLLALGLCGVAGVVRRKFRS